MIKSDPEDVVSSEVVGKRNITEEVIKSIDFICNATDNQWMES